MEVVLLLPKTSSIKSSRWSRRLLSARREKCTECSWAASNTSASVLVVQVVVVQVILVQLLVVQVVVVQVQEVKVLEVQLLLVLVVVKKKVGSAGAGARRRKGY